jgi:hypothetical protein
MVCVDCRANVIGVVPIHLYNSRRCAKCYPSYMAILEVENADKETAKKVEEVEKKKNESIEEEKEKINNRFDILDM